MTKPSRRWEYVAEDFERWQLDSPSGRMLAIVERPALEFRSWLLHFPLGWTWRTTWAGKVQGWRPTLRGAQLRAETRVAELNILEADREKFSAQGLGLEED